MSRSPLVLRDAVPGDLADLRRLFTGLAGRGLEDDHAADSVARVAVEPDQRLVVALADEGLVGGVLMLRAPLTPLHTESAVYVVQIEVAPGARRHGVGHALMQAVLAWAEEKGTDHVLATAVAEARDAHRFLARLGLREVAVIRGVATTTLRSKLPVEAPAAARVDRRSHRNVGQVLAARRSAKRAQARQD